MSRSAHELPFGAAVTAHGTRFRLFAPNSPHVRIALEGIEEPLSMTALGDGWHELTTTAANAGSLYRFVLPNGARVPDPASRFQPKDVHGPSEVIDPTAYKWKDDSWRGRAWHEAILYELHIGTFTKKGTFRAASEKLDYLVRLGVTAIELMCVFDFAGNRNWGYDGVLLYAPESAYGRPEDMKAFVDRAHAHNLMVIVDVVYNHFGPEGNLLNLYFPQVGSSRHDTPWGKSLNFDAAHGKVVRDFIVHNALYWVEEFHVDGLRLDATHAMVDDSPTHILDELRDRVRFPVYDRQLHLILESEHNVEPKLQRAEGGIVSGYTAQWNHDISHLLGSLFVDLSDPDTCGETGKLAKVLAEGFVIAAQENNPAVGCSVPPLAFVAYIQNHDLVGNRPLGERIFADAPPEAIRAIVSVYLLLPQVPMLFMGEEWGASTPFPFFCDYHGALADGVRKGRRDQLAKLDPLPSAEDLQRAPDPQAESTFRSAQLVWDEIAEPSHSAWLDLYSLLIHVRQQHVVPLLTGLTQNCGFGDVIAPGAFTVTWRLKDSVQLHLLANLCRQPQTRVPPLRGRLLWQTHYTDADGTLSPWTVRWTLEEVTSGQC